MKIATKVVHLGRPRPEDGPVSIVEPITATTNFAFPDLDKLVAGAEGHYPGRYYYRYGTPTVLALEEAVAQLEGADCGLATSSGMAAIAVGLLALVSGGRSVLLPKGVYGGTYALGRELLEPLGFQIQVADPLDEASFLEMAAAADVTLLEPITNPLVRVVNMDLLLPKLKAMGKKVLVDSTFTTPLLLQPLKMGADAVVHAASKYLSGHSDTTGGVLVADRETVDRARAIAAKLGCAMSPFDAFLILRGIRTLSLRVRVQSENALHIAERLAGVPVISRVYYPMLETDPHRSRAVRLFGGLAGGVLSFELSGGLSAVRRLLGSLKLVRLVPGLADVATTINHPASTSHRHLSPEERDTAGITDGLVRLSVGIEDSEDVWDDLTGGLAAL